METVSRGSACQPLCENSPQVDDDEVFKAKLVISGRYFSNSDFRPIEAYFSKSGTFKRFKVNGNWPPIKYSRPI